MKKIIAAATAASLIFCSAGVSATAAVTSAISSSEELVSAVQNAGSGSTIYLRGGVYRFDSPVIIDGIKEKEVTIASAPGETAILTNACEVSGWTECTVNGVRAFSAPANGKKISALFTQDKKLHISRLPETGYFYVDKKDLSDTRGTGVDIGSCGFFADDIKKEPSNSTDVRVEILHQWVSEVAEMTSFDEENSHIGFRGYTSRPIEDGDRYFLENVLEGLDKPGEWCFDSKADKIYYIPCEGENADNIELFASSDYRLMDIKNSSGITFKGIKFADTGWIIQDEKYLNMNIHTRTRDWHATSFQGAVEVPGAIEITYSDRINFVNCDFENIGMTAIRFFTGAKNCKVDSCHFDNTGASAVFVGGKFMYPYDSGNNPDDYASGIVIKNCEIENFGRQYFGACGIIITYCDSAEISNNEIHDGYYTGISAGYMWLFFNNPTENLIIKDNLIYNIGLDTLSDLGGIYLLGVQKGTVVSGNVIHDCTCYTGSDGYAGNGIYLDSGCEFMTVENNLVFNCATSGFNTTLSKNNIIRNNIFAYSGQSAAALGLENYNNTFIDLNNVYINNILLTDNKVPVIEYLQKAGHFAGSRNILWDMTYGDEVYFVPGIYYTNALSRETAEKQYSVDCAVYTDPQFRNAAEFDFTLDETSNAVKLGFEPFDYAKAGTRKGTAVGTDGEGGLTEYNSGTKEHGIKPAKISFIEKLKLAFSKFIRSVKELFSRILKTEDTGYTNIYTTDYMPEEKSTYTDELKTLFNEVKKHNPSYTVDESRKPFADDNRIKAIYFDGEECNGRPSEIFAYIGFPEKASADDPVPAMVLVHGGGVHAQADWVQYWVDRGYAAISMDGMAQEPVKGLYSAAGNNNPDWPVNPDSHMPFSNFDDIGKEFTQQWFYYYITDIILSGNILRSDSRIIPGQIGVAGISWGGLATTVAACYDERFEFAIPIYGCGCWKTFNSFFGNEDVYTKWDPTPLLSGVEMPMLFVSGDEDPFFNASALCSSAACAKNGSALLINGLAHGDFRIEETVRFANEYTGEGNGGIRINGINEQNGKISLSFNIPCDTDKPKVTLYYRSGPLDYEGMQIKEKWSKKAAAVSNGKAAVTIPNGTTMYYVSVEASCDLFSKQTITASTGIFKTSE